MHSKKVFFDTNIFVYFFEAHPLFGSRVFPLFEKVKRGQFTAYTSVLTQIELLSIPQSDEYIQHLQDLLMMIPNLTIAQIDERTAVESAKLRRTYQFHTPDAIQLAAAKIHAVDAFYTNDKRLKKSKEVNVILI